MSSVGIVADHDAPGNKASTVKLRATPTPYSTMHDPIDVASTGFLSNLPENCITRTWKNFHLLRQAAKEVFNILQENDLAGNQFIVVHGLSKHAIEQFTNDENVKLLGGIKYRFALEGVVGVIKIVPSGGHERSTDDFTRMMDKVFFTVGLSSIANYSWAGATRHLGTVPNSEKEPDQCLFPAALRPTVDGSNGWPTLVLETGVSESLPRLRADSSWWFRNSGGMTRFVIIIAIRRQTQKIIVQKWQLAPIGSPNPVTKAYIEQLKQTNPMPPLLPQPIQSQHAFCSQEVEITVASQGTSVTGAPMLLQSEALFDVPNRPDILLDTAFFTEWAGNLF